MTEPFFFAATAIAQNAATVDQASSTPVAAVQRRHSIQAEKERLDQILRQLRTNVRPDSVAPSGEFAPAQRPRSGSQLFSQRQAALTHGQLYTQIPPHSLSAAWVHAVQQPTYEQWRSLLAQEAIQVKNANQLGIVLGDSLSLWFPSDRLPPSRLWLNQSISGDTTSGILRRLPTFAHTRPQIIYLMAGVNDLKQGASDQTILQNLRQIIQHLRRTHPQAQIVTQSILPTRSLPVSNQRIANLNRQLQAIARQQGAYYLDIYSQMADRNGNLRPELTTDGLHLNAKGYDIWQAALNQADTYIATR
ncbi:MAG: GDSL-type esterase/lipase family protein [Leptolyngbyaceae cyanobacterium bins.349]|nr:GDSL-type esterase/lipase family protein [Leptolyngbyaceae cyanobacterium bins.349]